MYLGGCFCDVDNLWPIYGVELNTKEMFNLAAVSVMLKICKLSTCSVELNTKEMFTLVAVSVMLTICELSTAFSSAQRNKIGTCPSILGFQTSIFCFWNVFQTFPYVQDNHTSVESVRSSMHVNANNKCVYPMQVVMTRNNRRRIKKLQKSPHCISDLL